MNNPTDHQSDATRKNGSMQSLGSILQKFTLDDTGGHISREFQDYGYRLAVELNDMAHKSLYIKMSKEIDRSILEEARTFVLDAKATSRARLFMWKVGQIKRDRKKEKRG